MLVMYLIYTFYIFLVNSSSNDSNNTIESLYKYKLPNYKGKLDYELKVYKLDDSRIKDIIENKFSGNNENIYNQIQSFIDSNNLTMLAKIDIKIKHSYDNSLSIFISLLIHILVSR